MINSAKLNFYNIISDLLNRDIRVRYRRIFLIEYKSLNVHERSNNLKHYNVRNQLSSNTIAVIAENGLNKTAIKAIVKNFNIHETYIYQHFADKEELLSKMFDEIDKEFFVKASSHISVIDMHGVTVEAKCRLLFSAMWNFMLFNREKCITFVRYYYSPYFTENTEVQAV